MSIVPLNFCIAKIQGKYWQAIAENRKTIEIRDERVDADYFIFIEIEDIYYPIGAAIIISEQLLKAGSTRIPDAACTTMSELEHIYPHAIKNGVLVKPLYAYRIMPIKIDDIAYDALEKIM